MKSRMRRRSRIMILSALLIIAFVFAVFSKKVKITPLLASGYEIQGVDVSHYQGMINWEEIEAQNISFAFIKATEGSGMVDESFKKNWESIGKTSVLSGAYHFFSFDSSPETQAKLYIETVGDLSGRLLPVVDVEYYADKHKNPPDREEVINNLKVYSSLIKSAYGVYPIIYTTYSMYNKYIKEDFKENPLWIRNVYYKPVLSLGKKWSFWQYSDSEKLNGYNGDEEFIDRNVFYGSREDLENYIIKTHLREKSAVYI